MRRFNVGRVPGLNTPPPHPSFQHKPAPRRRTLIGRRSPPSKFLQNQLASCSAPVGRAYERYGLPRQMTYMKPLNESRSKKTTHSDKSPPLLENVPKDVRYLRRKRSQILRVPSRGL